MSILDHKELLACLDETEESPLKRFTNVQALRILTLKKGAVNEEEQKVVNAMASGDLALMRLGVDDKQATADAEIAAALAEHLVRRDRSVNRNPGVGTQPDFADTTSIDSFVIDEQAMRTEDTATIEELGLDVK